jgi:hypothetical protein
VGLESKAAAYSARSDAWAGGTLWCRSRGEWHVMAVCLLHSALRWSGAGDISDVGGWTAVPRELTAEHVKGFMLEPACQMGESTLGRLIPPAVSQGSIFMVIQVVKLLHMRICVGPRGFQ